MPQLIDPQLDVSVEEIASQALGSLYADVSGQAPLAVRSHLDADALLLLLRFSPESSPDGAWLEPLVDVSFTALHELVAQAVHIRSARTLVPGNHSVSARRGLAVFAFSLPDEDGDADLDPRLDLF